MGKEPRGGRFGRPLGIERLESRRLLAAVVMSDWEQLLVELVNRARADPAAEASRFGIALNDGLAPGTISPSPKQPLAPHQALLNAAGDHSQDMLDRNFFSHTNPDGQLPWDRMAAAGYDFATAGENISWTGTTGTLNRDAAIYSQHESLFLSSGHRVNLLHGAFREIGAGVRHGVYTSNRDYNASMVTEKFGARSGNPFITGVVYDDGVVADNFYTIGEGLGNVTVTAVQASSGTEFVTQSGPSGGYSLQVPAGTYTVYAHGGPLDRPLVIGGVLVGAENQKVDFDTSTVPTDTTPPEAVASAADIEIAGGATYTFSVTYSDDVAIDVSTLGHGNIQVSGPGGFSQSATFVEVNQNTDGTPRMATYRINAPGGIWQAADNGIYTLSMRPQQVSDTSGNFVPAGELASFAVSIEKPEPTLAWHNPIEPLDVDGDGQISPIDALLVINYLNRHGAGAVPEIAADPGPPPYLDVSGDDSISPLDALMIINHLNRAAVAGEGVWQGREEIAAAPELEGVLAEIAEEIGSIWYGAGEPERRWRGAVPW